MVLKNDYILKCSSGIVIMEDISSTQIRKKLFFLVQNLKIVRDNQVNTEIRGTKLYIEGKINAYEDFAVNKMITQDSA